jgi:guanylate kinase
MTNETKIFKKLRIVFDVDDVLVPFTKEICKLCKKKFNKDFDYKDVIWGFKNWAPEEIVYVESLFCNDEFIASLPMIRGAKKAVEWAVERGHEVLFCSSTYSNVMTTRALYLINKFKGIHPRNIILTGRKDVVRCDLAFDDAEHNLVGSIASIPVAVTSPWNAELKGFVRANGPEDYINIIKLAEQGYTKHEILAMQQAKYEGESPCCVVLVGPSGAGKTTVAEYLINNYPDRFEKVITDTTRQPREGEIDGIHYNFKTKEQFEALIEAEGYVEYSIYADKMYGSSKATIDAILAKGKCPVLVMDANGAKAITKAYPNNAFSVFLERTKEDLIASILERSVPQEDKIKRIIQLEKDFQTANVCTYLVKNNKTVKDAAEAVMNFIP